MKIPFVNQFFGANNVLVPRVPQLHLMAPLVDLRLYQLSTPPLFQEILFQLTLLLIPMDPQFHLQLMLTAPQLHHQFLHQKLILMGLLNLLLIPMGLLKQLLTPTVLPLQQLKLYLLP